MSSNKIILGVTIPIVVILAVVIALCGIASASSVPAVQWEKQYGGQMDDFYAGAVCPDGGYILVGSRNDDRIGWAVRVNSAGEVLWNKTYGDVGVGDNEFWDVIVCSDGGYVFVGYKTLSSANSNGWAVKVDSSGNVVWNKTFGGTNRDYLYSVVATSDGGYLLAGVNGSVAGHGYDGWLVKLDASGQQVWSKTYGTSAGDAFYDIVECSDSNYLLVGYTTYHSAGGRDGWAVKVNAAGEELWNKTYGGSKDDQFRAVAVTLDGGFIFAGGTGTMEGVGNQDLWAVKVGAAGVEQWSKTFGTADTEYIYAVATGLDGGILIGGMTGVPGTHFNGLAVKYSITGELEWNKTIGTKQYSHVYSILSGSDGGYILVGNTGGESDGYGYLVKLASDLPVTTTTTTVTTATTTPGFAIVSSLAAAVCIAYVMRRHKK